MFENLRRSRPSRRIAVGLAIALSASALSGCGPQTLRDPAAPVLQDDGIYRVEVLMKEMRFEPETITVPAGAHLIIDIENLDGMPHDLVLANGMASELLSRGGKDTIDVGLVEASIDAWCSIDNHRQQGMVMTING